MEMRRGLAAAFAVVLAALAPRPAAAFGHLWEFDELYSNADGSVQFIEMFSDTSNENLLSIMFIRTNSGQEFHFPSRLVGNTMDRHILIATAAFAAQPGAVTPDYIMPDGFLRPAGGDRLTLWSEAGAAGGPYPGAPEISYDSYAYGAGLLPVDGTSSIHRDHGSITTGTNSPTNFAGQSGSVTPVPEPATALLLGSGLAVLAARRRPLAAPRA